MKKTMKRLIACIATVMMVFSFTTTVFASTVNLDDDDIIHSGHSTSGYYTEDYVLQKNDTRLKCLSYESSGNIKVKPCKNVSGSYYELVSAKILHEQPTFYLKADGVLKHVHLRVFNYGSSQGVSTYSRGHWRLLP